MALENLEPRQLLSSTNPTDATAGSAELPDVFATVDLHYALTEGGTPLVTAAPPASAYTPQQIRKAYGIDVLQAGTLAGDGSGQTIAIVDAYDNPKFVSSTDSHFRESDLHGFDVAFGLADPPSFVKLDQRGGVNYPAPDPRSLTQRLWASEIALDVEWVHVIAPRANIVLVEADTAAMTDILQAVDTARRLPGVAVVSMSFGATENALNTWWGNGGELWHDVSFITPPGHQGVTFVASTGDSGTPGGYPSYSPNVLAVGGTALDTFADGTYFGEQAWDYGGGGRSKHEREPDYQMAVQSSGWRQTPDVAFVADPNTGVAVFDSYNFGSADPWIQVGGTSLSAPCWAGLIAIANQLRARQGLGSLDGRSQTLPGLYNLPRGDFHDITTGGNNIYDALPGYDQVTGLGTPRADLLVPDLAALLTARLPAIVDVTPDLSAGLRAPDAGSVTFTFNEPVVGSDLAANYELRRAGADGLLGTVDDPRLPVSVSSTGIVATVNFPALPEDVYRLTVRATITDGLGNHLDGDGDQAPGGDWSADFVTIAADASNPLALTTAAGTTLRVATGAFGAGQLVTAISGGAANAVNGYGRLEINAVAFQPDTQSATFADAGQTVSVGSGTFAGLTVAREVTTPHAATTDFVRTVDAFTNPSGTPITASIRFVSNLGSTAASSVFATFNGDGLVSPSDQWIGADGQGTPAMVHYFHGPGGLRPTAISVVGDNLQWSYELTVPAGETVRLAYFVVFGSSRAAAVAAAQNLVAVTGFRDAAGALLDSTALANFEFRAPSPRWPGLYDPATSTFYLRNSVSEGPADIQFQFGQPGAGLKPVAGDWDGDGRTTIGVYDPQTSRFALRNSNDAGSPDYVFGYGDPALSQSGRYVLLMGDWNGDGLTSVGLYDRQTAQWYLRNSNTSGIADVTCGYGEPGSSWTPIVGDWNGDGVDSVGFYDAQDAVFFLRNTNDTGLADYAFGYGVPSSPWMPIMGDWDRNATATIGFYDPASAHWFLRNSNDQGFADIDFGFGAVGQAWLPLVGNWLGFVGHAPLAMAMGAPAIEINSTSSSTPVLDPQAVDQIAFATAHKLEQGHTTGLSGLETSLESLMAGTPGRDNRAVPIVY